jgi:hypothetical protein
MNNWNIITFSFIMKTIKFNIIEKIGNKNYWLTLCGLGCAQTLGRRKGRAGYFCRGPRLKGGPKERDLLHFGSYFLILGPEKCGISTNLGPCFGV